MAGIYIHIPFCRRACHYCDFHFSINTENIDAVANAILTETDIRKDYLGDEIIDTIYFGGGTPSLLPVNLLQPVLEKIYRNFKVSEIAEITLEANPDDLNKLYLQELKTSGINRLSIGVQSFRDADLVQMNRAHNSMQALQSIHDAADAGFNRISIDLIYAIPGMDMNAWKNNVITALKLPVEHLSCYCLTVEAGTFLDNQVRKGKSAAVNDEDAAEQYNWLVDYTETSGFPWYEISSFSKPGAYSRHNSSYWKGTPYLGLGPSAHSFNGITRRWNIKSNRGYVQQIAKGIISGEEELLTNVQRFNETVLTSIRTRAGITAADIRNIAGEEGWTEITENSERWIQSGMLSQSQESLSLTPKGMLFADAIASSLFRS